MMSVLIAWSIGAALVLLLAAVLRVVVHALRLGGFRDVQPDHDEMSASRFTIPVSLIVPVGAGSDARAVNEVIGALLALNYPTFEVIVVGEGLPATDALITAWELEPREVFYRAALATAPVRMMYRSSRDARLLAVDKEPGNLADALNCGVNLARFRYVAAVEPGVVFDADALLRALAPPLRNPATVVGATCHVEIVGDGLQRLRSIRSMMLSRLIWGAAPKALGPLDTIVVWRRDAVTQAAGFSSDAVDPHLDMMVRVQSSTATAFHGPVVRTADIFGSRQSRPLVEVAATMARRQAAAWQAVASAMAVGASTRDMLARLVVTEMLPPFVQAWVVVAAVAGVAASWWPWVDAVLAVLLVACGQAVVSCAALLMRSSLDVAPDQRELRRLVLLAPLELILLGVVTASARIAGIVLFLRTPRFRSTVGDHGASPAV